MLGFKLCVSSGGNAKDLMKNTFNHPAGNYFICLSIQATDFSRAVINSEICFLTAQTRLKKMSLSCRHRNTRGFAVISALQRLNKTSSPNIWRINCGYKPISRQEISASHSKDSVLGKREEISKLSLNSEAQTLPL